MMRRNSSARIHADADGGLELAPRDGEIGGAEHLRLIGARDDADGERAGREGRHADEALVTERIGRSGQKRRRAEIDEIDDEQFRQAAEQSRVGLPDAAREQLSRKPRPGDEAADRRADKEAAGGDEKRHQRAFEERQPPAAVTETEDREIAHARRPPARALSTQKRAQEPGLGRHVDLEPLSPRASSPCRRRSPAASALSNFAVRSASVLRMPMPVPAPNAPPMNLGPTIASPLASGLEAVATMTV